MEQEEKKKLKNSIIACTNTNYFVILIPPEGIHLAGSFQFQVLYGTVTAYGFTQSGEEYDSSRFVPVMVHNKAMIPLFFRPYNTDVITANDSTFLQRVSSLTEGSLDDFDYFNKYSVAILVNVKPSMMETFLSNRIGNYTKPLNSLYKCYNVAAECFFITGVIINDLVKPIPPLIVDEELIFFALNYVSKNGFSIMVTGAKDIGKSTLNRFIANQLFATGRPVYMLDTDMGQTEFTPPGCLSLMRLEQAIMNPPFLHQRATFQDTYCLGTLSPAKHLQIYYNAVLLLYEKYMSIREPNSLLLINSHGWIEGTGIAIMRQLIQILSPTTIINMTTENGSNLQIPLLSPKQHFIQYKVWPRINAHTTREMSAKQWRDYAITGYFAQILDDEQFGEPSPGRTLADVLCYQVGFKAVMLYFSRDRSPLKDNMIFSAINCTIVALCGFTSVEDRKNVRWRPMCKNSSLPKIIVNTMNQASMLFKCYGYGLIRSIAPEKSLLYMVTPLSSETCKKVEVLVLPNGIHTPSQMLDRDTNKPAPYLVLPRSDEEYQTLVQNQAKVITALQAKLNDTTGYRSSQRAQRQSVHSQAQQLPSSYATKNSPQTKKARN